MDQTPTGWPATPWELTAPESYVLLHGPSASGAETFKLAVLELVARGFLKLVQVEEASTLGGQHRLDGLVRGARAKPPAEPALASVWTLYASIPTRTFVDGSEGVPVDELAREAQRRYKLLRHFVERVVMSTLLDRGLYTYEHYRIFWFFPASRLVLSPAGANARADLEARLALGREQFGRWVDADPARALGFVGLAGATLLLMSGLYPDLGRLGRHLPERTAVADGEIAPYASVGDTDDDRPTEPAEAPAGGEGAAGSITVAGLDPAALAVDFDLSALDSLDSAFGAIDLAVESSGGDSGPGESGSDGGSGGGNGGGGDSGGGAAGASNATPQA